MSNIADNLDKIMKKRGITQAQLARMADLDTGMLTRIMKGDALKLPDTVTKIADALNVHAGTLWADRWSNVTPTGLGSVSIPVLSYGDAVIYLAGGTLADEAVKNSILIDGEYSKMSFALQVRGDSMYPVFKEGETVIVDPKLDSSPGDYVFLNSPEEGAMLRQYRDGGRNEQGERVFEFHPINTIYAPLRSDRQKVDKLGVVVEHRVPFVRRK